MNEDIKDYLERNFLFQFGDEVDEKTDLLKAGLIDSYGYVLILLYLEKEHGLRLESEEVLDKINFSLEGISNLVATQSH